MNLIIRSGGIEDADNCAKIVSNWISATEWMPRLYSQMQLSEMIKEAIPQREFWVVGQPIIGYLSFNVESLQVVALYTATPGKGIGKALLDKVKERYRYMHLWSHSANIGAHKFYRREGFNSVGSKKEGTDGIPEIQFEWSGS